MKKRITIIIIAVALLSLISWAILRPPAIECIALEYSSLENSFTEIGEVIPLMETDVYGKIGGRLLEVKAFAGSNVNMGDLLFVFDTSELTSEEKNLQAQIAVIDSQITTQLIDLTLQKSSLESAIANNKIMLEQAQTEVNLKGDSLQAATSLYEIGGLTSQELLNAQSAYEQAYKNKELLDNQQKQAAIQLSTVNNQLNDFRLGQGVEKETDSALKQQLLAQKNALEIQLALLAEKLDETEVNAPLAGIVRDSSLKTGQIIPYGTKLCSIYQADFYRIDCYILVENTAGINIGDKVEITLRQKDGDKIYAGLVDRIALDASSIISKVGLSEKRVKVEISMAEENWEGLGPYWPVEVCFITAKSNNCLMVPKTALFEETENNWNVWVIREGKTMAIAVERGIQTPSQVEIRGEIFPGDIIIKNAKTSKITVNTSVKAVL
ncbi:MAG: efflux RND transporter periplasmic adaptor subunit [Firmicutes bacterium]|nr:efflux RND transporter periplasmic adaptor subunit [Bacillota bacterium]